ncbi:MAG: MarR family winged helix-turn-helix transcriptional regulator [Aestuariibacter sp.]
MNKQQLLLENQLCHRLYMANNTITRSYRPLLEQLDLTYPQYLVMMALWQEDNVTVTQLQKRTQIDSGALTLILKKMQEKTLLRTEGLATDKRKKHVMLTQNGRALQAEAAAIPETMRCQYPQLLDDDLEQLKGLLDKLLAKVDD